MSTKMKKWLKAAGIRALKTFAQTMASLITVGEIMNLTDWKFAIASSLTAFVYSIFTSLAGLPEIKEED